MKTFMYRSPNKGTMLLVLIVIFVSVVKFIQIGFAISDMGAIVVNFEQCVAVGNPIMESYPRRCHSAGNSFIEEYSNAHDDLALTP